MCCSPIAGAKATLAGMWDQGFCFILGRPYRERDGDHEEFTWVLGRDYCLRIGNWFYVVGFPSGGLFSKDPSGRGIHASSSVDVLWYEDAVLSNGSLLQGFLASPVP